MLPKTPTLGQALFYKSKRVHVTRLDLAAVVVTDEKGEEIPLSYNDAELHDPVWEVERRLAGLET